MAWRKRCIFIARNYRPSADHPAPKATICVWALAADSDAEARRLLHTREHWRVGFEQGVRNALLPPDVAAAQAYTPAEKTIIDKLRGRAIVGTAGEVATRLRELAKRLALDELVIVTWTFDSAPRHRSYELLAAEFGLSS